VVREFHLSRMGDGRLVTDNPRGPEQLRDERLFRYARAVDRDAQFAGPPAVEVHDAGEKAAPGAPLPGEQHRAVHARDPWRVAISPRMGLLSPTMDWTWWAARISDFRNRFSRCICRWEYAFSTRCSTSSVFSGFMM